LKQFADYSASATLILTPLEFGVSIIIAVSSKDKDRSYFDIEVALVKFSLFVVLCIQQEHYLLLKAFH